MKTDEHVKLSQQAELSQPELENLKHSLWEIDCPQIALKRRSPQSPLTFHGSGFLRQVTGHKLTFRCYADAQQHTPTTRQIRLGETVPDEAYYDLTALDYRGRTWHCERILIDLSRAVSGEFIARGNIPKITCEGIISQKVECAGNRIEVRVFHDVNIPFNERTLTKKSVARGLKSSKCMSRNTWKFRCCRLDFLLTKEDENLLVIDVSSDEEDVSEHLRERVLESLQFVLGHPICWAASYKRIGHKTEVTLCSPRKPSENSRFRPPFILGGYFIKEAQVFRHLFSKYLQHIIDYEKPMHPLWAQLNAIYEASSGTFLDAHALTLAVAIESIVSSEFPHLGELTTAETRTIQEALKHIEEWSDDTGIKERITGAVKSFSHPNVSDKMKALMEAGAITKKQWKAWKNLRNKSTHSYQTHGSKNSKFVKSTFQINVLVYHLIFYAIGYEGPYMDVSELDFPIKEYPPGINDRAISTDDR